MSDANYQQGLERVTAGKVLTPDEASFIATRMLARARHSSKKLASAIKNSCHPQLLVELRADIAECTRLATKLLE
jgi:hypothetical protein